MKYCILYILTILVQTILSPEKFQKLSHCNGQKHSTSQSTGREVRKRSILSCTNDKIRFMLNLLFLVAICYKFVYCVVNDPAWYVYQQKETFILNTNIHLLNAFILLLLLLHHVTEPCQYFGLLQCTNMPHCAISGDRGKNRSENNSASQVKMSKNHSLHFESFL